jgi:hypothetical protein
MLPANGGQGSFGCKTGVSSPLATAILRLSSEPRAAVRPVRTSDMHSEGAHGRMVHVHCARAIQALYNPLICFVNAAFACCSVCRTFRSRRSPQLC